MCVAGLFFLKGNDHADSASDSLDEPGLVETSATRTQEKDSKKEKSKKLADTHETESSKTDEKSSEKIMVDVKGAVKNPGVVEVKADMRVKDAVNLCGGFSPDADTNDVNLAQSVKDQMVIYVSKIGEEKKTQVAGTVQGDNSNGNTGEASNQSVGDTGTVDINQATVEDFQKLNGIGQKKAEKIVQYREQNGPFKSVDDLKNVSGIGEKTIDNFKDSVTCN
jgi:competence protein ComEA